MSPRTRSLAKQPSKHYLRSIARRPNYQRAARVILAAYRNRNNARKLLNAASYLRSLKPRTFKINPYKRRKIKRFFKVAGRATGPTHSTTRMIVRPTPARQRFLRKLFKTNPMKTMYVNRFGFAWMGASAASKTIWYSVTSLKFNNVNQYMKKRLMNKASELDTVSNIDINNTQVGNAPDAYIYIGKCTYQYEIYNPTNYLVTVFIYDLICKRDTPYNISYANSDSDLSSAPENMMRKTTTWQIADKTSSNNNYNWKIGDSTVENSTFWNSIGMKPTDYHYFNTFWKVKGMKKIVLAPGEAHHHRVIYNPKSRITQASLYMPRQDHNPADKLGIGGLTISTLFGFQGQVAVEDNTQNDNTDTVGTLPGKLIISFVKKENIYTGELAVQGIVSDTNMIGTWTSPKIFTDLVEQPAGST